MLERSARKMYGRIFGIRIVTHYHMHLLSTYLTCRLFINPDIPLEFKETYFTMYYDFIHKRYLPYDITRAHLVVLEQNMCIRMSLEKYYDLKKFKTLMENKVTPWDFLKMVWVYITNKTFKSILDDYKKKHNEMFSPTN